MNPEQLPKTGGQILIVSNDPEKTEEKLYRHLENYELIECHNDWNFITKLINKASKKEPIQLNNRYHLTGELAEKIIEPEKPLIVIITQQDLETTLSIARGRNPDEEYENEEQSDRLIEKITQELTKQHHEKGGGKIWWRKQQETWITNLHFLAHQTYGAIEQHFHNNTDLNQIAIVKPQLYRILHSMAEDTWSSRRFWTYTDEGAEACFGYNHGMK